MASGYDGSSVVAMLLDGSVGYWDSCQAGAIFAGIIVAILASGTYNGNAVSTTAASVDGLLKSPHGFL